MSLFVALCLFLCMCSMTVSVYACVYHCTCVVSLYDVHVRVCVSLCWFPAAVSMNLYLLFDSTRIVPLSFECFYLMIAHISFMIVHHVHIVLLQSISKLHISVQGIVLVQK